MGTWGLVTGKIFKATPSRALEKHLLEHKIKAGVLICLFLLLLYECILEYSTGIQENSSVSLLPVKRI